MEVSFIGGLRALKKVKTTIKFASQHHPMVSGRSRTRPRPRPSCSFRTGSHPDWLGTRTSPLCPEAVGDMMPRPRLHTTPPESRTWDMTSQCRYSTSANTSRSSARSRPARCRCRCLLVPLFLRLSSRRDQHKYNTILLT